MTRGQARSILSGSTVWRLNMNSRPDHDNRHVQDRSGKTSSQLYHPRPCGKFRFETPSGGYCNRKARLTVVRTRLHINHPNTNSPSSVFRDSAQTLEKPLVLCRHGLVVKVKTSRCVHLPSYRLRMVNRGLHRIRSLRVRPC